MGKPNQVLPFTYDGAKMWDSDVDEIVEIALEPRQDDKKTGTKIKYKETFFVFTGQESGEKLIRWWMNYIDKIWQKQGLS